MKSTNTAHYKIGVFGSATQEIDQTLKKAKAIGKELGKRKLIVITGATSGIPNLVAVEAHKQGSEIWGFSPATTYKDQLKINAKGDNSIYKKFFYVPKTYEFAKNIDVCRKYRNVDSTASCDGAIIIAGRWGTLNEFTNLVDMGKVIGVLTGTGGIADELPKLTRKINKANKSKVIFSNSPEELIIRILTEITKRA